MSLTLPNLDDRTYADLLAEAQALLPSLAPEWTDFNPADPGITLIELFAWLTEMLLYRIGRLPEATVRTFLRLLNGASWTPGPDLAEDVRLAVLDLRARHRAVTAEDYAALAREAAPQLARAHVVPRRDLRGTTEAARTAPLPGYASVIVVPARSAAQPPALPPLPDAGLLRTVQDFLEPRRLLTVHNPVVGPVYVPVQPRIVLARRPGVDPEGLRQQARAAIEAFLDPLSGGGGLDGGGGTGWPFGRDVYVSELYQRLEALPGVDYVPDVALASVWPPDVGGPFPPDLRAVPGDLLWHESGDPIGLKLAAHQLPWARIDPDPVRIKSQVAVGTAFVPVRVRVAVTVDPMQMPSDPGMAQQWIQGLVRVLFHPLEGGPAEGRTSSADVLVTDFAVRARLLNFDGVVSVGAVVIEAPPDRQIGDFGSTGARVLAGELFDCRVTVEIEGLPRSA
jgi:hypothetical protein